jgi:YggT family protein
VTTSDVGNMFVTVVNVLFQFASFAILARVILSWLPMAGIRIDPYHPLVRFLYQITDPLLEPLRRITTFGMIDFSPVVALILLEVIRHVLVNVVLIGF